MPFVVRSENKTIGSLISHQLDRIAFAIFSNAYHLTKYIDIVFHFPFPYKLREKR